MLANLTPDIVSGTLLKLSRGVECGLIFVPLVLPWFSSTTSR